MSKRGHLVSRAVVVLDDHAERARPLEGCVSFLSALL